jgi:hypothetical protein
MVVSKVAVASYWLKYRGTRFPLRRGETLIGRSPYCSIVISSSLVSREHAALRLDGDTLVLADLGSTNGTSVNGEPLGAPRTLQPGDVVRIGSDLLEVQLAEQPAQRAAIRTRGGADTVQEPDGESDGSTTATSYSTLELIEALVASAGESGKHDAVLPAVQRGVSEMITRARAQGQRISHQDALRLAVVVERVTAWIGDASGAAWRDATLAELRRVQA